MAGITVVGSAPAALTTVASPHPADATPHAVVGFRRNTLGRLERRVSELNECFETCLDTFKGSDLFSGPSQYFHLKTLATLTKHRSAVDAFHDDTYVDSLYATLTAWGLHRMGPGNTKLRDIEEIRRSLILNTERIRALEQLRLSTIPVHEEARAAEQIWAILRNLKVSRAKASLVANSKALHHVLPALVPPIDREYILKFFFARKTVHDREEEAFRVMFPHFCHLARSQKAVLEKEVRTGGWNSSETKVVDNAIVGYLMLPPNTYQAFGCQGARPSDHGGGGAPA